MGAAEKQPGLMPFWPAAMPREMALAYTQVSAAQMDEWEQSGKVRFSARGARGARIALRADLDAALLSLVESGEGTEGWFGG